MGAPRIVAIAVTGIAALVDSNADVSTASMDSLRGSRQLQQVTDDGSMSQYNNHTGPLLSEAGNELPPGSLNLCEGDW